MKIINLTTGQAYQLAPGTQLEIERPNLFFNDYGEQSYPVDLPDTDLNRALCGYPDQPANRRKPLTDIPAAISEGDYYMPCRQAVLGAKRKEKITTSFYMNEGSFLSRMQDVPLVDVFGDETIPGVSTVQEAIEWCRSLMADEDPHYSIFPIIADIDGEKRGVNIVTLMDADGHPYEGRLSGNNLPAGYSYDFYHAFDRTEKADGQVIQLSPGYYITPFIRANYLLQRVFAHFGYTLEENFFSTTRPFDKMVFVNNTADSLVNGTILLTHLVPDCYCNTLVDVFRKKFCCEFVPDETARTVRVEFFKDIMTAAPSDDLTDCLVGHPEINYQEPRQLKLSSEESLTECSSYEGTNEILRKYPTAYYNPDNGRYLRTGYGTGIKTEILSDGNLPYYAASQGFEDYEVTVPDCQYYITRYEYVVRSYTDRTGQLVTVKNSFTAPYVGEGRMLNSTLEGVASGDEESTDQDEELPVTSDHKQSPTLSFVNSGTYYATGTNHAPDTGYSLLYNGPIGIFETFWRDFDNLLHNALHQVNSSLLLDNARKRSLPAHRKVVLSGNEYLLSILRYTLGGKNEPTDTELLTTLQQEPISIAPDEGSRFQMSKYAWDIPLSPTTQLSEEEWKAAGYTPGEQVNVPLIYPPMPTQEQYDAGGKYYTRTVFFSRLSDNTGSWLYFKRTVYLEPKLASDIDSGRTH